MKLARIAAALADMFFGRFARHNFIEHSFLARLFAQDATESLNMFTGRTRAGQDHGDGSFRDVHTFIQNFRCCQGENFTTIEGIEPK
jgi:hypothetical protein